MTDIPLSDLQKHLDGIAKTFEEPLPDALSKCAHEIRQGYLQNFDSASSPNSGAWPPRKDPRPTHPLLVLSGKLKAAATQQGASGNVSENDGRELAAGVEKSGGLPYTHAQFYGYRGIQSRKYIDIGDDTVAKCEQHVADDLAKKLHI